MNVHTEQKPVLPPIFVVGAPRSGTTLTGKILGCHPQLSALGESHFFEDIWTRRKQLGALQQKHEVQAAVNRVMTIFGRYNFPQTQQMVDQTLNADHLVSTVMAQGGGYAALYQVFMGQLAAQENKIIICDDTPKHLFYIADLFRLFPDAKVIGCVHDPRDFLCSYKFYWRRSTEGNRVKALYHPIITSLLWRTSAKELLKWAEQLNHEQFLLLRYEDLVSAPEEQVHRLCDFAQLEYTPALLKVESNNSSFGGTKQGIFANSVGRWQKELSAEEIWWAQQIGQRQMEALHYIPQVVTTSLAQLTTIAAGMPIALHRALKANQHKRGPLLQYLWRRTLSMVGS